VDGFLRIPFGTHVPLPVKLDDGPKPCAEFLATTRKTLDSAVYGMQGAKTQIMQILAQWISNPQSVGNVIALRGPMGVGKTSFARNGVAKVLNRPFEFFSLGGASDSANFVGHSFTYEGSTWGRIADSLMTARCMNPVMYFDELDKVSTTPHGEEIVSMLIHMTDRSQNTQFHDRYFAGVEFDLSQCLFVFSYNDESKIHPVLRDRMQVIQCNGYTADEKKTILTQYVWPQILERIKMNGLTITDDAVKFLINDYSNEEEGVRTLIRAVETLVTRINLLRIADEETAKSYPFYMKIQLPMEIRPDDVKHILNDMARTVNESWRHLYV
jgi:ATP-dependent Lon protease